jgi:deazaflavin-dependent oxidoreductase (nitroreductase family)
MSLGAKMLSTRWMVRAPIGLFKARLGFLFGGRILMLVHRGRKSGLERFVVLETVARESRESVLIASGFGTGSEWYRNLEADPACQVSIGFRNRVDSRAELLDKEESKEILDIYSAKHPTDWKYLKESITELTGEEEPEIPMVRLHLNG